MREVKWKLTGLDKNDIVANYDGYCLRVERMNKNRFWYCVYFKNDEVAADYTFGILATTLKEGKNLAETIMWMHMKFNNSK